MCGRFSLTVQEDEIERLFNVKVGQGMYVPRYNGAPTQNLAVITGGNIRIFNLMRWGLVPSWAKDPRMGSKLINARAETILQKPAFRQAFKHRRCLVPADGFYEWKKLDNKKIPCRIMMNERGLFAMAGIYEAWKDPEGKLLQTFSILTTVPNEMMGRIHDRMPVIIPPESYNDYLQNPVPESLLALLQPYPSHLMTYHPVSTLVNSPLNDDPRILEPANIPEA